MFESNSWEQVIDRNFIHSGSRFVLVEERVGQEAQQNSKYTSHYNTEQRISQKFCAMYSISVIKLHVIIRCSVMLVDIFDR